MWRPPTPLNPLSQYQCNLLHLLLHYCHWHSSARIVRIAAGLGINSIGFSLSLYVVFLFSFYVYLLDVIQCSSVTVRSATKRRYLAGLDIIAIWLGWIILDYSLDGLDIFLLAPASQHMAVVLLLFPLGGGGGQPSTVWVKVHCRREGGGFEK